MAAITSAQDGDWNTDATWTGGVQPVSGDTVTVSHNITVTTSEACSGIAVDTAKTVTISTGGALAVDGGTFVVTGTINVTGTGSITSSVNITGTGAINLTGTAGNYSVLTSNAAASQRTYGCTGTSRWEYATVTSFMTGASYFSRIFQVEWLGVSGNNNYFLGSARVDSIEQCWFATGQRFGTGASPSSTIGIAVMRNVAIGYKRDGSSSQIFSSRTWRNTYEMPKYMEGIVANGGVTPENAIDTASRLAIDNFGFLPAIMLPGTASALDSAVVARGTYYTTCFAGTIQRSATSPQAGTYCALCTGNANTSSNNPLDIRLWVPIQSGDNISVTAYASRAAGTSAAANITIDPSGEWFTTVTSAEALTNTATFYQLTASASTAAGSGAQGSVLVVLRTIENTAVKFDTVVVTVGTKTYNCSMDYGQNGQPTFDQPTTGGATPGSLNGGIHQ